MYRQGALLRDPFARSDGHKMSKDKKRNGPKIRIQKDANQ
jgi:hypothetical protein